ncbi:MAG: pyridoxamine 5'-phosphate oxidase family protein [Actinomycetota bacterium]|nr:pyridoxamine 5'-phosphate oxidase family protein [Actinomycetota bacterium]
MSGPMPPRTRLRRLRERQVEDRTALDALLDEVLVAHVGLVVDGYPLVVPTAFARDGDQLLIHGSTGSGWMRAAAAGAAACLTVTALDGLVVARSTFESSMRYRSAVVFGVFRRLDASARNLALDVVTDKLLPGRRAEVRPSTAQEQRRTLVLTMPIERWSLKVSDGWPDDAEDDRAGPAWAGVIPLRTAAGGPVRAPDLEEGVAVPHSVRAFVDVRA